MKAFVFLACLVVYANAHACFIFPQQRGNISSSILTKPGNDDCLRIDNPPCGNENQNGPPKITYMAGSNSSVIIQKNLDHFYSQSPGNWEVYLWSGPAPTSGKLLISFPDTADFKTLDTKTLSITIPPDTEKGDAILQLIYNTNNPSAPAHFYQCADIKIA